MSKILASAFPLCAARALCTAEQVSFPCLANGQIKSDQASYNSTLYFLYVSFLQHQTVFYLSAFSKFTLCSMLDDTVLHRLFGGVDSWCVFGPKGRLWRIIHRSQTWNSPKTRKEDRFLQFASIHNRSSCFLVKITFSAFQEMLFPCMTNSGQFEHICQLCNCILHCIGYIGGILKRFR